MKDANDAEGRVRKAPRAAGGQVAQVLRQFEAQTEPQTRASPSPPARPLRSTSQAPAATAPRQSAGRKRKTTQQPTAPAAQPGAWGSTTPSPPAQPTFADVVAGRTTAAQSIPLLVGQIQNLEIELGKVRAFGERTHGQLQQEREAGALKLEHLLRHSKRNNLVVFGVPESLAYSLPAQLARHMQGVLFQATPASELTTVRSPFRLGKWKQGQLKPRAVLVELMSVGAKHTTFQASSRLRAARIRLDEDLTPQQMQQRKGLSTDFQCLKARGYKPFFRGATLRYRDGPVIRKCARGEANKVVAAAAQAARAAVPPPARQPRPQRTSVAINPSEVLHESGVSMVNGTLGPLMATEAQAFSDVVRGFGASDGGV